VRKGQLTMQLKRLRETQEKLAWPSDSNDLPVISWDSCECPVVLDLIFMLIIQCLFSPGAVFEATSHFDFWIYPRRLHIHRGTPWRCTLTCQVYWFVGFRRGSNSCMLTFLPVSQAKTQPLLSSVVFTITLMLHIT
jgi:hypothetical protein